MFGSYFKSFYVKLRPLKKVCNWVQSQTPSLGTTGLENGCKITTFGRIDSLNFREMLAV